MKLLITTIITTSITLTSLAQELTQIPGSTLPSPNSTALLEYANVPVNLYTGVPQISVPIYDLPSRTITVPVSLSYHAQGIKVHEIASSVGLGWTLNAGGAITRVVRGLPDEVGFYGAGHGDWMDKTSDSYMAQLVQGLADSEPDIFYFNFMGRTGKFVIDKDGNPHIIPHQNLIIEKGASLSSFTITDDNGMIYEFNETETTTTVTSLTVSSGGTPEPIPDRTFKSTWYLTRVTDANDTDEVTFHYSPPGGDLNFTTEYLKKYEVSNNDCDNWGDFTATIHQSITIDDPKYLDYVESKQGKIEFKFLVDRPDLTNGQSLDKIIAKDNASPSANTIITYDLNYRDQIAYYGTVPEDQLGTPSPEDSRLMLEEITQVSGSSTIIYRSFTYNDKHLPSRFYAFHTDHWGYFNLESTSSVDKIPAITTRIGTTYPGDSRKPNYTLAQADILKRVTLATGGYTEFEYEENSEFNNPPTFGKAGGGVRIKKIRFHDGISTTNNIVRAYLYSKPQAYQAPKYFYDYWQEGINYDNSGQEAVSAAAVILGNFNPIAGYLWSAGTSIFGIGESEESCQGNFVVINSHSFNELYDLNGVSIGYGQVDELLADSSKTVSFFTNFDDRPDDLPVTETLMHMGIGSSGPGNILEQSSIDVNGPPFSPYNSKSWERGLLKSQRIYDGDGNIQRLVTNSYDFNESTGTEITALAVTSDVWAVDVAGVFENPIDIPIYNVGEYKITSRPIFLESTEEITWDQNGGHTLTTKVEYEYDPNHLNLTETRAVNSRGETVITRTKYANDYVINLGNIPPGPTVEALLELRSKNMNVPIEQVQYLQKPGSIDLWAIGGSLTTYKVFNQDPETLPDGQVYPYLVQNLELSDPIQNMAMSTVFFGLEWFIEANSAYGNPVQIYEIYNTDGNLLSETRSDGIVVDYTWGYNNTLPLTVTTNPDITSATKTTTYEHKPLVGVSKQIDPNGRVIRYEYDEFNRLGLVVDHEGPVTNPGKILKKYEYKVASEL